MGVKGLFIELRSITRQQHLRDFSGMRVAIDAMIWLYQSAYSCAKEVYLNPRTPQILPFCMKRLQNVIQSGLIPLLVFDGRSLPSKSSSIQLRHESRLLARQKLLQNPDSSLYAKALSITFETCLTFLTALKSESIPFLIAPYEADAQIAFLARNDFVDCVLSNDSDLIPYQCPLMLFKLNDQNNVDVIRFQDVLSFLKLNEEQLIAVCVLAGCDYAPLIERMGLKMGISLIKQYKTGMEAIKNGRKIKKLKFPLNYESFFRIACLTYRYQKVYHPVEGKLIPLEPIENAPDFLGPEIPEEILQKIVTGELDPHLEIEETEAKEKEEEEEED
jgi:exonuclease-1